MLTIDRTIAIDWSGAKKGAEKKIFAAVVENGELLELKNGRTRQEIGQWLRQEAANNPHFVVGFDFPFSFPAWFVRFEGCDTAAELWARAAEHGEDWLSPQPEAPFFTKGSWHDVESQLRNDSGSERPLPSGPLDPRRQTDQEYKAETVFKRVGPRQVAPGGIRGMKVLRELEAAGFSVWPFDPPSLPLVIEIYPGSLYQSKVVKTQPGSCQEYLRRHHPGLSGLVRDLVSSSEDAFDAAISAYVMDAYRDQLANLSAEKDPVKRLEGAIWTPRPARSQV